MEPTKLTGFEPKSEQNLPATWGGANWRWRERTHAQEVAQGVLWHPCGYHSEIAPLQEVLLSWPGQEFCFQEDPDVHLMLERPDLPTLQRQTEAIAQFYEAQGVVARVHKPSLLPPPNHIFMRDLFTATPEGIILARPAPQQRAGEERFAAEALASYGIPILRTLQGSALLEGADVLWLNAQTVLVGTGRRTNQQGYQALAQVLGPMGVEVINIDMPSGLGVQHLLGVIDFIDHDLVAVDQAKASPALRDCLQHYGFKLLEFAPDEEMRQKRGMNFVTLAPRHLVMPAHCPQMRRRFEAAGVQVESLEISEYLKAGGGLACLTGIIARQHSQEHSTDPGV